MPVPSSVTIRLNVKTLLIVLVITVSPLVLDLFLVLDRSRADLTEMVGEHFETAAQSAASGVARFIESRVADLKVLASLKPLRRTYVELSPEAVENEARLLEINRDWETPKVAARVSKVVANPASVYLREYLPLNPTVERILVTDSRGLAIAATHKPIRYSHGDQRWWIYAYGDGRSGRVHVADAEWDPVSMTYCVAIAVPAAHASSGEVAAIIRGFVDVAEFDPLVASVRLGETGHSVLAKADGTIVSTRQTGMAMNEKAEAMEIVGPMREGRVRGSLALHVRGGQRAFAGYAEVPLSRKFPEIDWTVIVTQDFQETAAPISRVNTRALASGFLAILIVGGLAVYFTTHRPRELDPMDNFLKP